jgi:hypothetical protein
MNLKYVCEDIGGNVETKPHIKLEGNMEGTSATVADPLPILNQTADLVLAYRPKIKTKAAKRRARRNKRAAKAKDKPKSRESTI